MNTPDRPTPAPQVQEISQEQLEEDELVEVGQVSQTKGGILGSFPDPFGPGRWTG